jgi:hypothetical protein
MRAGDRMFDVNTASLQRDNALLERARTAFMKENEKGTRHAPPLFASCRGALCAGKGIESKERVMDNRQNGFKKPRNKFQGKGQLHVFRLAVCHVSAWLSAQARARSREKARARSRAVAGASSRVGSTSLPGDSSTRCLGPPSPWRISRAAYMLLGRRMGTRTRRKAAGITSGLVIPMRGASVMLWHAFTR